MEAIASDGQIIKVEGAIILREITTRQAVEFVGLKSDQTFRKYAKECNIKGHSKRGKGHVRFYWREDIEKLKRYLDTVVAESQPTDVQSIATPCKGTLNDSNKPFSVLRT